MADTVKKSRIVSEPECLSSFTDSLTEDTSLQDIINEEFNQRLKNCMKKVCIWSTMGLHYIFLSLSLIQLSKHISRAKTDFILVSFK